MLLNPTSVNAAVNYSVAYMCRMNGKKRNRHVQFPSSGHIISLKEIVHTYVVGWVCVPECVCVKGGCMRDCFTVHIQYTITLRRKLGALSLVELIDGIITVISKQ